jgi:hypothetical protein
MTFAFFSIVVTVALKRWGEAGFRHKVLFFAEWLLMETSSLDIIYNETA